MHWRLQQLWNRVSRRMHLPSALPHMAQPILTPTYDGSGQVTHPDVLDFVTPWQGYRFWMVTTPYPFLDDQVENPSVLVSHNGEQWQPPPGLRNPLVQTPKQGFHADPDWFYHPQKQQLWLYYLHTERGDQQGLMHMRSQNGVEWSTAERILTLPYQTIRSPAFLFHKDEIWMWSVNISDGRRLEWWRSTDGIHWQDPEPVALTLPGYTPSHVDVVWDAQTNHFFMVIQADPLGGGPNRLFLLRSTDPKRWKCGRRPLLSPFDAPPWAEQTLYRSSFTMANGEDDVHLWYSGRSGRHENRISHQIIARQQWLSKANGPLFS
ncbi:hypothetical protein [Magnetococcus sp. PR-3]|uniref:hypothetical protein n=1 Tax=Magnetococcus sp. PR-3 TaxID=3120355 RepID=UPI002FCE242D